MNIGVGVTTHNREDLLGECLRAMKLYGGIDYLVVVDDGSKDPEPAQRLCEEHGATLVRHNLPQGIPAAKNKCLETLMDAGCTDLFLFDDDTYPVSEGWYRPYVESPEPYLTYCWTHFKNGQHVEKMDTIYRDDHLAAYTWSMGCMQYVHRDVVSRVGGLHFGFGMGMEEHADWAQRIHNAGFTTFMHQDVAGGGGLFYAGDEHCSVKRSFAVGDRMAQYRRNEALRLSRQEFAGFEPYRVPRDVVLTSYLAGVKDDQRATTLPGDKSRLAALLGSVKGYETVVLNNCFDEAPGFERAPATRSPYQQRWINQLSWLRKHPEVRWVWMVDATDVRMLKQPEGMVEGILYVGYEPKPVGITWMRQNAPKVHWWIDTHASETLLNCGVVGGDRETMIRLCQLMVDLQVDYDATPLHEMAFFNMAAREIGYETGPKVVSLFKHNETEATNSWSWWAHK